MESEAVLSARTANADTMSFLVLSWSSWFAQRGIARCDRPDLLMCDVIAFAVADCAADSLSPPRSTAGMDALAYRGAHMRDDSQHGMERRGTCRCDGYRHRLWHF
jgi:hypothetical protein